MGAYVYWGSEDGYSSSDLTTLPTYGTMNMLVEDLNGDGWLDLAFACYYSGSSHATDRDDPPVDGPWGHAVVVGQ